MQQLAVHVEIANRRGGTAHPLEHLQPFFRRLLESIVESVIVAFAHYRFHHRLHAACAGADIVNRIDIRIRRALLQVGA